MAAVTTRCEIGFFANASSMNRFTSSGPASGSAVDTSSVTATEESPARGPRADSTRTRHGRVEERGTSAIPPTLRAAPGLSPRFSLLHVNVVGQAEEALADDVAQHLRRAAAHGEGGAEQEAVSPLLPLGPHGVAGEHAVGAEQVLGEVVDLLAVRVVEGLAQRRVGARLLVDRGGDLAQLVEAQDLPLDVRVDEALAQHEIVEAAGGAHLLDEVVDGGAVAPDQPALRQ